MKRPVAGLAAAGEPGSIEEDVGRRLVARGLTLAVAESCTGGLLGHRLTQVSGSSAFFLGGVIAYANAAKVALLGVDAGSLARHGAVSAEVAAQMAAGARARLGAGVGVGITGIAGPAGGTAEKPVGLVYVAVAEGRGSETRRYKFEGGRGAIKQMASQAALEMIRERLGDEGERHG